MNKPIDSGGANQAAVEFRSSHKPKKRTVSIAAAGVSAVIALVGCEAGGSSGSASVNVGRLSSTTVSSGILAESNSLFQVKLPGVGGMTGLEGTFVRNPATGQESVITIVPKEAVGERATLYGNNFPYTGLVRESQLVPSKDKPTIGVINVPAAENYINSIPVAPLDKRPKPGDRANVLFISSGGYGSATPVRYLGEGIGSNIGEQFYALPTVTDGEQPSQDAQVGAAVVNQAGQVEGVVVSERIFDQRPADELTGNFVTTTKMSQVFPIIAVLPVTPDTVAYTFNPKSSQ